MAKLYHKNTIKAPARQQPDEILTIVQTFLAGCRRPAVLEYGDEMMMLVDGLYALEIRSGAPWIDVWNDNRSLSRRILTVEGRAAGSLDCTVHRFGGKPAKLSFLDVDRPQTAHKTLCGARQNFAEQFRRMLFRQFPGWEIEALSCSMDLRRSFSPLFPRARLAKGDRQIAALACPELQHEPAMLTFALIWYDYIRSQARKNKQTTLCLFFPEAAGNLSAHRLRWLTGESLPVRLFRFNPHGSAGEVDGQDLGNLETQVRATALQLSAPEGDSERSLELAVRSHIATIDATLLPDPIHGQVLTFAAGDRDLIDLLATSDSGRLAVLELKVTEDLHLPLQALDYWMRIRWHAERGELQHLFPKIPLATAQLPKLLLIAPAMSFHSSNTTVLRYFSREIEVERVGVSSDWQRRFKVVMRLAGSAEPISHGVLNEYSGSGQH